jgi:hypothetical protein
VKKHTVMRRILNPSAPNEGIHATVHAATRWHPMCLQRAAEAAVAAALVSTIALALLYAFPLRRWFRRWGATRLDRTRAMPGDPIVVEPTYSATLAIAVAARPEAIWPWLVQMGYRRGGLYSYDWLDRLFGYLDRPSAERVLPEFQQLAVGDVIPVGARGGFPVKAVEPFRTLLLAGQVEEVHWAWQFGLFPFDEQHTRLISRNSVQFPRSLKSAAFLRMIEPAAFIMTRKMLLGIKRRAERLSQDGRKPKRAA